MVTRILSPAGDSTATACRRVHPASRATVLLLRDSTILVGHRNPAIAPARYNLLQIPACRK